MDFCYELRHKGVIFHLWMTNLRQFSNSRNHYGFTLFYFSDGPKTYWCDTKTKFNSFSFSRFPFLPNNIETVRHRKETKRESNHVLLIANNLYLVSNVTQSMDFCFLHFPLHHLSSYVYFNSKWYSILLSSSAITYQVIQDKHIDIVAVISVIFFVVIRLIKFNLIFQCKKLFFIFDYDGVTIHT